MPRKKQFAKLINRSIGLTEQNLTDIEQIKNSLGIVNDSEVIRRSISFFASRIESQDKNKKET